MREKPKLKIFDEEPLSSRRTCSKSSLKISTREIPVRPSESLRVIKMSSCRNLLLSITEQDQASREVFSDDIKHVPLDEPLMHEGQQYENKETDESLFKDLMDGRTQNADQLILLKVTPPQQEVDPDVAWPIPDVVTSTFAFTTPLKTPKAKSCGFPHFTDSNERVPTNEPESKLIDKIAGDQDELGKPQRIDADNTNETVHHPKFYSEITNIKGKRFLIANFKESIQKLEEENNELRLKMLNSALEELRK